MRHDERTYSGINALNEKRRGDWAIEQLGKNRPPYGIHLINISVERIEEIVAIESALSLVKRIKEQR